MTEIWPNAEMLGTSLDELIDLKTQREISSPWPAIFWTDVHSGTTAEF